MTYKHFLGYSFAGSVLWISAFVYGGYYFGNIPFVKQNLTWFIIGIVLVSIAPGAVAWLALTRISLSPAVAVHSHGP